MIQSKTVEISNVGPVFFERSRRALRLVISIRPVAGIRVAVPRGVSFEKAEHFALSKISWIRNHLSSMEKHESEHKSTKMAGDEIDWVAARLKLIGRLFQLAERHQFSYNRVSIRNQRTRWGSCSAKNNISLNINLVRLPDELMDYVILHELVHTRIKNHRREFWAELDSLVGSGKCMAAKVKEYGAVIL